MLRKTRYNVFAWRVSKIGALHGFGVEAAVRPINFAFDPGNFLSQLVQAVVNFVEAFAEDLDDITEHRDDLVELFAVGSFHTVASLYFLRTLRIGAAHFEQNSNRLYVEAGSTIVRSPLMGFLHASHL